MANKITESIVIDGAGTGAMSYGENAMRYTQGSFYTDVNFTAPTANRTLTMPNGSGELVTQGDMQSYASQQAQYA